MTDDITDYGELLAKVMMIVASRAPRVIGIEGFMNVGKTPLAQRLSSDLDCAHVETDNSFLKVVHPELLSSCGCDRNRDRDRHYIDCLDLAHLCSRIEAALEAQGRAIVEGVCLQDVLSRIGKTADCTIYVKKEPELHSPFLLNAPEQGRRSGQLHRDIREYHSRVRPHEIADLIFRLAPKTGRLDSSIFTI